MSARPAGDVRAGDIVQVDEPEYLYGEGTLTMRVERTEAGADPAWVRLVGVELLWDSRDGDRRDVLARVRAIRKQAPGPSG